MDHVAKQAELQPEVHARRVVVGIDPVDHPRQAELVRFHRFVRNPDPKDHRRVETVRLQFTDDALVVPRLARIDVHAHVQILAGHLQLRPDVRDRDPEAHSPERRVEQRPDVEHQPGRRRVVDPLLDDLDRPPDREPVRQAAAQRRAERRARRRIGLPRSHRKIRRRDVHFVRREMRRHRAHRQRSPDRKGDPEEAEVQARQPVGVVERELVPLQPRNPSGVPVKRGGVRRQRAEGAAQSARPCSRRNPQEHRRRRSHFCRRLRLRLAPRRQHSKHRAEHARADHRPQPPPVLEVNLFHLITPNVPVFCPIPGAST